MSSGTQNRSYSRTIVTGGGTGPLTFSVSVGTLPTGLSINTTTGVISGTPSVTDTKIFTIRVVDVTGAVITKQFSLRIVNND